MQNETLVIFVFVIILTFSKVQCGDLNSKQPFIYDPYDDAKINFFYKYIWSHLGCMEHCRKLGGRSPPIRNLTEWLEMEGVLKDLVAYAPSPGGIYLSIIGGGEFDDELDSFTLEHWPKDIVGPKQGAWRDYYTGEVVEKYNISEDEEDPHCAMLLMSDFNVSVTPEWLNIPCTYMYPEPHVVCPCEQKNKLLLRGTCLSSNLFGLAGDYTFNVEHIPSSFEKIFFKTDEGWFNDTYYFTRIDYNTTTSRWVHTSNQFQTSAFSLAKKETYLLGKYNWTVSNDRQECHLENGKDKNEDYTIELKLSGCNQGFEFDGVGKMELEDGGEFTCNDGQCVRMEKRCDQLPDCDDLSDEEGCQLFSLAKGYNKVVPPYTRVSYFDKTIVPVEIDVSIKLLKMMGIDERENSIDLQFEIILEWKDHRITYSNLKKDLFLNALTEDEKNLIWLPIVVYANTDQKATTRLGWTEEWSTEVVVSRDGNFTRQVFYSI